MKQTVIDILIYLFENYIDDEIDLEMDHERIRADLGDAGFDSNQVTKAFEWLQSLALDREHEEALIRECPNSLRVYAGEEIDRLDTDCRGFLHFLEQIGVLDATNRELVIDRVLALESDEIDLGQLKWIILMILFNQPGHEQAFIWMEGLVMDEVQGYVH